MTNFTLKNFVGLLSCAAVVAYSTNTSAGVKSECESGGKWVHEDTPLHYSKARCIQACRASERGGFPGLSASERERCRMTTTDFESIQILTGKSCSQKQCIVKFTPVDLGDVNHPTSFKPSDGYSIIGTDIPDNETEGKYTVTEPSGAKTEFRGARYVSGHMKNAYLTYTYT